MTDPRYDYLALVFEDEFPETYWRFFNQGILYYELTNILELLTDDPFDEDDRFQRYGIIGTIADYLEEKWDGI